MDIFEPQGNIESVLIEKTKESKNTSQIYYELQARFGFNYNDIEFIMHSCPAILNCKVLDLVANLRVISGIYNLQNSEVKYLVLKKPDLLLLSVQVIKHKIKLVASVFGISIKDSLKIIYVYPELLSLDKKQITAQIKMVSKELNQFGLAVRRMFKTEPRLLFISEKQIDLIKKFLMRKFTLSENECYKILSRCPTLLLLSLSDYQKRFDSYYQSFFIKRDFKEMFVEVPEVLKIEPSILIQRIKNIEKVFNVNTKRACEFVRKNPNVLFFEDIELKLKEFSALSLNIGYIFSHPSLFSVNNMGLTLKFLFARILNKEGQFESIYTQDLSLLLAKFIYLQTIHSSSYSDICQPTQDFCDKYGVSEDYLKYEYKPSASMLEHLFNYYYSLKGRKANWTYINMPNCDQLSSYIKGVEKKQLDMCLEKDNKDCQENLKQDVKAVLKGLYLNQAEIDFLFCKNSHLFAYNACNVKDMVNYLKKNGYSLDAINYLLLENPSLFTYSIKDFAMLVEEVMDEEEIEQKQAIEYLIKQ